MKPDPKIIILYSTEHELSVAYLKNKDFLASKFSDVLTLLINVKMPTIVDILTFKSMINCMLSCRYIKSDETY